MNYLRCTQCSKVLPENEVEWHNGREYHAHCVIYPIAKEKYPDGYAAWVLLKQQVDYLSKIHPGDLYANESKLTEASNALGFNPKELS